PYPTASFQVYLPDTGLKLDGSPLQAAGPAQLGGQSYALYSASNLPKSTMVGGQLSGLGSNGAIGPNQLALISLGVVLFVIGGGGLTARYPGQPASRPALVEVDLDVEPGQRLLLIGPNGAGKSTFIRVFAGLMHAAHGKALITGLPAREVRNLVGVVSHATYLY